MKLYYIANFRMPTEKAHGIQVAKMCEALIEAGANVTLVVPNRKTVGSSMRKFYGLRVDVPLVRLFAFDWYASGRILYFVSSFSFMISSFLYLWRHKRELGAIAYTIDADNWSYAHMPLTGMPYFSEMHNTKPATLVNKIFFRGAGGVIAINALIAKELQKRFSRSRAAYLVEPNGVDISMFAATIPQKEARSRLGIPLEGPLALYTGRFFAWKGLEVLSEAARFSPEISWRLVGGTREEFKELVEGDIPANLSFEGERPYAEIPLWLFAADALIVLGTARDQYSYYYTSPMKLFDYLAAGRPIVASNTPAVRQIVSSEEALLWEPDNARDLAEKVRQALNKNEQEPRIQAALQKAKQYSWDARARAALSFIHAHA